MSSGQKQKDKHKEKEKSHKKKKDEDSSEDASDHHNSHEGDEDHSHSEGGTRKRGPRDQYGFEIEEEFVDLEKKLDTDYRPKLEDRKKTFESVFEKKNLSTKSRLAKRLIRLGIPNQYRAKYWLLCSGAKKLLDQNPGYYQNLLKQHDGESNKETDQIELDVRRTFPGQEKYETQEGIDKLRRVLSAYSWKNPDVGYCQSMNFICGLLLIFMEEEEAFWMMVNIIEKKLPNDYYTHTMIGSLVDQLVLGKLLEEKVSSVDAFLKKKRVTLSLICNQWFLCLFINTLPLECTLRIWDVFFSEGSKVLFRVALALMKMNKQNILQQTDDSHLFQFLREFPRYCDDPDGLLRIAFHELGRFPGRHVVKYRDHFRPVVLEEMAQTEKRRREFEEKRATGRSQSDHD